MRRRRILAALALLPALFAGAAAASSAGEKKKGGGETFLQFPALAATVLRFNGRRGVLTVESGLDVPDEALRTRAEESAPRLRDAYVRLLSTYAMSLPPGAPPDADAIGATLQRATDEVLGRRGARVLLGTILLN